MKSTYATLAVAGLAAAAPHNSHRSLHEKKDLFADFSKLTEGSDLMADISNLMTDGLSALKGLGALQAKNSKTPTKTTWVGGATDGNAVVNTIVNKSKKDAVFTCWGAAASWVNAHAPEVAVRVPAGKNVTISHAIAQDGAQNIGGCAPVFDDTKLDMGQISNSWLEFTWLNDFYGGSTYDLSMEVNPQGHNMSIAGPKCKSDLTQCSFHCNDASAKCGEPSTYHLLNCEAGSQEGASAGKWGGQASGGCQGISNTGITKLTTTLH